MYTVFVVIVLYASLRTNYIVFRSRNIKMYMIKLKLQIGIQLSIMVMYSYSVTKSGIKNRNLFCHTIVPIFRDRMNQYIDVSV